MKKNKLILVPMFQASVLVTFGMTGEQVYQLLQKHQKVELHPETEKIMREYKPKRDSAITFSLQEYHAGIVIIFDEKPITNVIPHEAFHAVYSTLRWCGIELSRETDEVYAHFAGWLTEEIFRALPPKKKSK